ncbi:MAG: Uma2 family endonuclease [Nitriliruptoraceae bacterium]
MVRGRLVREPRPNLRHGAVQVELAARILAHARETVGGTVLTEPGVILSRDPDTVRGPDVAFYSRGRLPRPLPNAFAESPPDLVAEILSPHDPATRIQAKVKDGNYRCVAHAASAEVATMRLEVTSGV